MILRRKVPSTFRAFGLAVCLAGALLITGCDGTSGPGLQGETTFDGRVTDDAGFGKTTAAVEGAVVTASNVTAGGSTNRLDGQATTDAQGRFALYAQNVADEIVLVAEKDSFTTKTMVYTDGRTAVRTMPMTTETHAEAEVFVEARRHDEDDGVAMSDVAAYVTSELAAHAALDGETAAAIAATIVAEARTRKDYMREDGQEDEVAEARDGETNAFVEFQTNISSSTSAAAETAAIETFEQALIEAYSDAGVSAETQAKARQAARAAVVRFSGSLSSDARFQLQKKSEILAALATSEAVAASFRANGASSARLDALQQAKSTFVTDLRAATSATAIADARAEYEAKVESELAAEIGVSATTIATTDGALSSARNTLELALAVASTTGAVAQAHAAFYTSAEAVARGSLSGNDKAELGAEVLAMLSVEM